VVIGGGGLIGAKLVVNLRQAGPEPLPLHEVVGRFLGASKDPRKVVPDVHALYFGTELNDRSLTLGANPRLGATRFADWLARSTAPKSH